MQNLLSNVRAPLTTKRQLSSDQLLKQQRGGTPRSRRFVNKPSEARSEARSARRQAPMLSEFEKMHQKTEHDMGMKAHASHLLGASHIPEGCVWGYSDKWAVQRSAVGGVRRREGLQRQGRFEIRERERQVLAIRREMDANKIQAAWRGRSHRNFWKQYYTRRYFAAKFIQKLYRGWSSRRKKDAVRTQRWAVTKIQVNRKRFVIQPEFRHTEEVGKWKQMELAATKINAAIRGHMSRKEADQLREMFQKQERARLAREAAARDVERFQTTQDAIEAERQRLAQMEADRAAALIEKEEKAARALADEIEHQRQVEAEKTAARQAREEEERLAHEAELKRRKEAAVKAEAERIANEMERLAREKARMEEDRAKEQERRRLEGERR